MRLQFCGAARSVTGSRHLLTTGGKRILLDCGLFQGHRADTLDRNKTFPFDPASVDAMILSHAHIDHSGNIPNLVKQGFKGNIFCSAPTFDLCTVMLQDSAFIQERDADYLNKRLTRKQLPLIEPLYRVADAQNCLSQFVSLGYNRPFEALPGIRATFFNAGHMLGSAMVLMEFREGSRTVRLGFTGDLGRKNLPIIEDPDQLRNVDFLISESTYGNKEHDPAKEIQTDLVRVLHESAQKNGKIIIPAFSVERTQEVIYHLNALYESRLVPAIPVFVDSPLSVNVTEVFKRHPTYWDRDASRLLAKGDNPFVFPALHYIASVEESKSLNDRTEPCIIIAASGMCEAGRILHHLANNIEDSRNTILIVGFMAEHTLGRRLVDKAEKVKILGEEYTVRADVVKLNAFSGHADKKDLLGFVQRVGRPQGIFLVHGEPQQSEPFAAALRSDGHKHVAIPALNEIVDV